MERSQFTFYQSFANAAARIRSKAARCDFYEAIINYALYEQEPDLSRLTDAASLGFLLCQPSLDSSRQKAIIGRRGGKAEANGKQTASRSEANRKQTASRSEANGKQEEPASKKEIKNKIEFKIESEKEIEIESEEEKEEESHVSAFTAAEREKMIVDSLRSFSEELREAVRSWVRYKTERREPYKRVGFAALLSRIAVSAGDYGDRAVIDAISQSMSSGYKGIVFDRLGQARPQPKKIANSHTLSPEGIKALERLQNLDVI